MAPIFTTFILSLFFFLHHIPAYSPPHPTGFTVDLIHLDYSPLSPFYNPSHTKFDRLRNTIHRSLSRASKHSSSSHTIPFQAPVSPIPGDYFMNLSIGTPHFETLAIADTGSDLSWTQCQPCTKCYNQHLSPFDPRKSSTFKNIPCNTRPCDDAYRYTKCGPDTNFCQYSIRYLDNGHSEGDLAADTLTFKSSSGHPVLIPNIAFGCGHDNNVKFSKSVFGLVGLGRTGLSLIKQMDKYINGKFSHCLVPINQEGSHTGKINFGSNAVVSGPGVVSTPLIKNGDVLYFVTLKGISVSGRSLAFKSDSAVERDDLKEEEGNIVIDSGSTLTLIPIDMYNNLVSILMENVKEEAVKDPKRVFKFCYKNVKIESLNIPTITFHFTGADLNLGPEVTFVEAGEGLACLGMIPMNGFYLFGNLLQRNVHVGYNLVKNVVSFKPTDCAKL